MYNHAYLYNTVYLAHRSLTSDFLRTTGIGEATGSRATARNNRSPWNKITFIENKNHQADISNVLYILVFTLWCINYLPVAY